MLPFAALLLVSFTARAGIPALIVDGQNNHDFRATTPHLKKLLEETGLLTVEVATSPRKGESMGSQAPGSYIRSYSRSYSRKSQLTARAL